MNRPQKINSTLWIVEEIKNDLARCNHKLRAFSLKLTGNIADAEDLYQDTALRIFAKPQRFQIDTNFEAWAITIMRNLFINNYRKKVRRNTLLDASPNYYYLNVGQQHLDNDGEMWLRYLELLELISHLNDNYKVTFLMSFSGYKLEEIAQKMNTPLGTVKSRIHHAKQKLQRMYKVLEFHDGERFR